MKKSHLILPTLLALSFTAIFPHASKSDVKIVNAEEITTERTPHKGMKFVDVQNKLVFGTSAGNMNGNFEIVQETIDEQYTVEETDTNTKPGKGHGKGPKKSISTTNISGASISWSGFVGSNEGNATTVESYTNIKAIKVNYTFEGSGVVSLATITCSIGDNVVGEKTIYSSATEEVEFPLEQIQEGYVTINSVCRGLFGSASITINSVTIVSEEEVIDNAGERFEDVSYVNNDLSAKFNRYLDENNNEYCIVNSASMIMYYEIEPVLFQKIFEEDENAKFGFIYCSGDNIQNVDFASILNGKRDLNEVKSLLSEQVTIRDYNNSDNSHNGVKLSPYVTKDTNNYYYSLKVTSSKLATTIKKQVGYVGYVSINNLTYFVNPKVTSYYQVAENLSLNRDYENDEKMALVLDALLNGGY